MLLLLLATAALAVVEVAAAAVIEAMALGGARSLFGSKSPPPCACDSPSLAIGDDGEGVVAVAAISALLKPSTVLGRLSC